MRIPTSALPIWGCLRGRQVRALGQLSRHVPDDSRVPNKSAFGIRTLVEDGVRVRDDNVIIIGRDRHTRFKSSRPLRVLFCGSDEFSGACLKALHKLSQDAPELIQSIDVLCRPGKLTGRGLKTMTESHLKAVAQNLGLNVHERDTFTGWDLPFPDNEPINLIIAVSFGLFVPARILQAARYGGLNIHPSFLPQFRGPSPLQYAILANHEVIGITLQTLDKNSFDRGVILGQARIKLSDDFRETVTVPKLAEHISPFAAELLVRGILQRVYVPPYPNGFYGRPFYIPRDTKEAPKVRAVDRQIRSWQRHLPRKERAFGPLWIELWPKKYGGYKRVVCEGFDASDAPKVLRNISLPTSKHIDESSKASNKTTTVTSTELGIKEELRFMVTEFDGEKIPIFFTEDGDSIIVTTAGSKKRKAVSIKYMTADGQKKMPASTAVRSFSHQENGRWIFKVKNKPGRNGGEYKLLVVEPTIS